MKTKMKFINRLFSLLFIACLFLACSKDGEIGPIGPEGPQGKQGEKGDPGEGGAAANQGAQGEQGPAGSPGEDGQDGADGQDGQDGQDGEPGTANVYYSPWIDSGFETPIESSFGSFTIDAPELTQEVIERGAVLVYGIDQVDEIRHLPVTIYGILANEYYSYRFISPGFLQIDVNEINGGDVNFPYMHTVYRYVIIPGGIPTSSRSTPTEDYTKMTYEEIAERFNIPD